MAPHEQLGKSVSPRNVPAPLTGGRSTAFGWSHPPRHLPAEQRPDPIATLEWLDDLIFAAIEGDPVALDCAAEAWQKTQDELGESALEESRQQYLRRAQTVWHSLRHEPNHPPHKVFAAIEIISLLADKAR
ncbi:MAG TPA: hypothetical protein VHE81_10030 [Lacipirellulaceae bacterium]|nr:hypothetical protein [Lacipirellulaceae bacterium]